MALQDHERIAAALRKCRPAAYTDPSGRRAWSVAVSEIAKSLRGTEGYDEDRFLDACGYRLPYLQAIEATA